MTNNRKELTGKQKFLSHLSSFLEQNKTILLIILAAVFAVIIAIAVIDSIKEKNANKAAVAIEEVQSLFDEWSQLADDDADKAAKETVVTEGLDSVISDYPASYASQRAFYLKGNMSFMKENWAEAAGYFNSAAAQNTESYLAPISLMLTGASYENAGMYQEALDTYIKVYAAYDKVFPDIPRAMLSIGRLNDQLGNKDAAIEAYNNLIDSYPGNQWSSFARTRIIQLD